MEIVTTTIQVSLEGSIKTTPSGHNSLIRFYDTCKQYNNRIVFIDLAKLYWIDANLSAVLQAIMYKLHKENSLSFIIDVDDAYKRFPILFRNGFLSSFLILPDGLQTTVEIQTFRTDQDLDFFTYINQQLLGNPQMAGLDCKGIDTHFYELFANIGRHARTEDPVFVCGQYYRRQSKLHFTITDLGVGFLPPIHAYTNGDVTTSIEAIKWAVQYNHSTKERDETGGLGLYNLLRHCEAHGGEFNIITGNAYWGNNLGEMGTRTVPEFVGTTIHLIYNCK